MIFATPVLFHAWNQHYAEEVARFSIIVHNGAKECFYSLPALSITCCVKQSPGPVLLFHS